MGRYKVYLGEREARVLLRCTLDWMSDDGTGDPVAAYSATRKLQDLLERAKRSSQKDVMITLKDIQERADAILKRNPNIPRCGFMDCENAIDYTKGIGWDTSCPYHRLLFDHWLYDMNTEAATDTNRERRRAAFRAWVEENGKDECDRIVLEMAQWPGNWMC